MTTEREKTSEPALSLRADTEVKTSAEPKVFEEVFRLFKSQLIAGELRPSDKLLPERELSQKLGVSRASLREVMRVLALLGVVEIRPGQGAFIRAPDLSILQDFFGLVLAMQPTLYEHLLEARIAIECRAIRLACRQASPEDHARIASALKRIASTVDDPDLGAEADFDFHAAIVRASQNEVLLFIHEAIASHLRRSHHERREAVVGKQHVLSTLSEDHSRVYEAILEGDPDNAETLLRAHFTLAQRSGS
jgi:GntR family transcriptional regulator, transcriptional repressor for pyruvate dehydrogenase complex